MGKQQYDTLEDYVYDPQGHVTSVHDGAANLLRAELYSPDGRHVATFGPNPNGLYSDPYPAGLFYNHTDWLGTERVRTDINGNLAETCTDTPYGMNLNCVDITVPADIGPLHFTGKQRDYESGLDYFGARFNASNLGRFMTPDKYNAMLIKQNMEAAGLPAPMAASFFDGYLENPQNWNQYAYVRNNPLTFTDPTGAAPEGHHLFTVREALDNPIAKDFVNAIKTGPLSGNGAPNQPGFNAMHQAYNDAVESILQNAEESIGNRNDWSISQWKDFANRILNSDEPAIKNFLDELEENNPGARGALAAAIAAYRVTAAAAARAIISVLFTRVTSIFFIIIVEPQAIQQDQEHPLSSHPDCLLDRNTGACRM